MILLLSLLLSNAMKFRAALLDMDGTLLDTESLSDRAMFHVYENYVPVGVKDEFEQRNYRLPWELKRQILGLRGSEWAPIVIDYGRRYWSVTEPKLMDPSYLWSSWEASLNNLCDQVGACPGALELVQKLSAEKLPMAIATSSRGTAVLKKRKNHENMFQHISVIVPGDHPAVRKGKPAPDIYLEAARQLGVDPKECIVFEDALSGMRSGKAAGCFVVGVPDPRFTAKERKQFEAEVDLLVDDLTQFDVSMIC